MSPNLKEPLAKTIHPNHMLLAFSFSEVTLVTNAYFSLLSQIEMTGMLLFCAKWQWDPECSDHQVH